MEAPRLLYQESQIEKDSVQLMAQFMPTFEEKKPDIEGAPDIKYSVDQSNLEETRIDKQIE